MTDESDDVPKDLEERFLAIYARRDECVKTRIKPIDDYDAWFAQAMELNAIIRESLTIWKELVDRNPGDEMHLYRYNALCENEEMRLQMQSGLIRMFRRPDTAQATIKIMDDTLKFMSDLCEEAARRTR